MGRLARDKGAPADYVACGFLTVVASLIGGKRRVQPYGVGSWREPPILWLGLVGDPSFNKSPALDPLVTILRKIEREYAEAHRSRLADHTADVERVKIERQAWEKRVKEAAAEGLGTPPLPEDARDIEAPRRRRRRAWARFWQATRKARS
jgi:hypothetical protein